MEDILLNGDLDLIIENGDFKIGDATLQNQNLILIAKQGEIRRSVKTGVGVGDYLLSEGVAGLETKIKKQFKQDGMTVRKVDIDHNGTISIDANY